MADEKKQLLVAVRPAKSPSEMTDAELDQLADDLFDAMLARHEAATAPGDQ